MIVHGNPDPPIKAIPQGKKKVYVSQAWFTFFVAVFPGTHGRQQSKCPKRTESALTAF